VSYKLSDCELLAGLRSPEGVAIDAPADVPATPCPPLVAMFGDNDKGSEPDCVIAYEVVYVIGAVEKS